MEERITSSQFVELLRKAPEWAVDVALGTTDMRLVVRVNGEIKTFLGPDMLSISDVEQKVFLAEVRRITQQREPEGSRLY